MFNSDFVAVLILAVNGDISANFVSISRVGCYVFIVETAFVRCSDESVCSVERAVTVNLIAVCADNAVPCEGNALV